MAPVTNHYFNAVSGSPEEAFLDVTTTPPIPPSLKHIKGYQVSAIVVCVIVLLAVIMCHVTWRLRFKIVLRQKDPNQQSTVVQNLVALELQVIKSGGEGGGMTTCDQPAILLQEEGEVPGGLDSNVLVPITQISDEDVQMIPPGFTDQDMELTAIKEESEEEIDERRAIERGEVVEGEDGKDEMKAGAQRNDGELKDAPKQEEVREKEGSRHEGGREKEGLGQKGLGQEGQDNDRQVGRLSSGESKSRHDRVMARLMSVPILHGGSITRTKTARRKGRKGRHPSQLSLRTPRLSSGYTLPRRVDLSRLSRSGKHPLILEDEDESSVYKQCSQ